MKNMILNLMLALLSMIGALGIDAYLPAFQSISQEFAVGPLVVQQTLSIYVASMALTMLFSGTLSDTFGRRPLVLLALGLFTLGSILALTASHIQILILARMAQGIAAGISSVLARAMVQDAYKGSAAQQAMALISMVFSIAPALAPLIGGWLQAWLGWRAIFAFLALYSLSLGLLCYTRLPETLRPDQRRSLRLKELLSAYQQALKHPRFMLMVGGIAMIFGGVALYVSSASAFVIGILGLNETAFGWLFLPMTSGMVLGSMLAARLAHTIPAAILSRWGLGLTLLAALSSLVYTSVFVPRVPYAVLPLAIYALGLSLAMPGMMVMTLDIFKEMRGLAASLQSFVQMMVFALVTAFLSPLVFHSAQMLALSHVCTLLVGIVFWALAQKQKKQSAPPVLKPHQALP